MVESSRRQAQSAKASTFAVADFLAAAGNHNRKCFEPAAKRPEPCATNRDALIDCATPDAGYGPEARFMFRRPLPLQYVDFRAPEPGEAADLRLSHCIFINIDDVIGKFAVDLLFEQSWHFQKLIISGLAGTIPLGPSETLRLTFSTSQRKFLNRTTLNEVEETESTESTIVDRDAVNVTRSSSATENWEVSANAQLSIPIGGSLLGFGGSGGMSGSATLAATATAESVSEATRKSAHNLKNLHRLEVVETTETTEQNERSRRLVNPYRDRSLLLKIYALAKEFCVDFALRQIRPVILLEITNIAFDRHFVTSNGDFLDKYLVDRRLSIDLPDALAAVIDQTPLRATPDLERLSAMALKYLFDEPNIFNVKDIDGSDANIPDTSFNATIRPSALADAIQKKIGVIFTTLNFYFKLYRNEVTDNEKLAVDLVLSLEQTLGPQWAGIEQTDGDVSKIFNESDHTEGLRRLGGFLSFVSGTIRPLVKPSEDERTRIEAARRAEFAISRVIDHLNCNRNYYIGRYLTYVAKLTNGSTLQSYVESVLELIVGIGSGVELQELFATEGAFVDRNMIVVPGRCAYSPDAWQKFAKDADRSEAVKIPFGVLSVDSVVVPCEGAHIEVTAGKCRLEELPETLMPHPVEIAFGEEPLSVRVIDRKT